ncbi:MAG: FRG domain-containing protein [Allosphingosinicella sp.]
MGVDQRVSSFQELQEALYEIRETKHRRHRSDYVYRGVDDCSWGLETSLQRLGEHYPNVEGPLLRNFVKYAGPGEIPGEGLFFKLAVAQHHGLPTRVLDWTTAPRVAIHFATADEAHYDRDGAIWCVDVVRTRDRLPAGLKQILDDENAFIFSVEMLERYTKLGDLDKLAGDFVVFFEPPSLDQRIVNQGAVLSVLPSAGGDLKALLDEAADEGLYKRIIIPKEIKWEIRDKLDQDNVTERMLFPGLDGTSRWLKRYYGLGPTKRKPALGNPG